MKKLYLSIILAAMMIGYYSCKKDYTTKPFIQEDELTTHSKKVLSLIKSFDEKMKRTFKSSEQIELDSAVWNIEALLNYSYSYPDSSAKDFVVYKSNYTMDIDANGMVAMGDVEVVYNQMEDSLNAQFNQIPCDIKHLRFSDVALDSVAGSTAYLTLANGYGFNLILGMYYPFEEDDDWYWGTDGEIIGVPPRGKCDGSEVGVSDGSNELAWRLNNPVPTTQATLYTDIETFAVHYMNCTYNEPPQLPRVFSTLDGNYCMENDTLTFYLEAADLIIFDYNDTTNDSGWPIVIEDGEGARPAGKDFVSVEIVDDFSYYDTKWFHHYQITYGIPTYAGTD